MGKVNFKKQIIGELVNDIPPVALNAFSAIGDINNDGFVDFVLSGRSGRMVWFENPGIIGEWKQHFISDVEMIECGGRIFDVDGDGYQDVVCAGDWRNNEVYWFRNPADKKSQWNRFLIAKSPLPKFHDISFGDITGDGVISIVFTNQRKREGTTIFRIPISSNPSEEPWPSLEIIASGKTEANIAEEGLCIADIDGDGKNELICGTSWYKYDNKFKSWKSYKYAKDYVTTKIAVGDIDNDGKTEIVLSEGDSSIFGRNNGSKIAWFKQKSNVEEMWEENLIDEGLLDVHSLQVGDILKNSYLDIFAGEIGVADIETREYVKRPPCLFVYENDGKGNFKKHIIDEGTGTHDAFLVDLRKKGVLDIIGKPLHGKERWKAHVWYNQIYE